jgi:hypothetical protein
LSLAYYGNQLFVYFRRESIIAHSISHALAKAPGSPVSLETIITTSQEISHVFKNEFLPVQGNFDAKGITNLMEK